MVVRDPGRIERQRRFFRLDLEEPLETTATLALASCANPQSGLSMDSAEKLYGTASSGGGTCAASLFGRCTVLVFDAVGRGCLSSTVVSRFLEGEVLIPLLGRAPSGLPRCRETVAGWATFLSRSRRVERIELC